MENFDEYLRKNEEDVKYINEERLREKERKAFLEMLNLKPDIRYITLEALELLIQSESMTQALLDTYYKAKKMKRPKPDFGDDDSPDLDDFEDQRKKTRKPDFGDDNSPAKKPRFFECKMCGSKERKLFKCQDCKSVVYCGQECQELDWNAHKSICLSK